MSPVRSAATALERLLLDGRDSEDNDFLIGTAVSAGPSYSGASDFTYSIRPAARLTWRGYSISSQSVARASARTESTAGGERTGFSGPLKVRNRFSYGLLTSNCLSCTNISCKTGSTAPTIGICAIIVLEIAAGSTSI